MSEHLGHHLLFDCYGCRDAALGDAAAMRDVLVRAAAAFGLTVIAERLHQYLPQGVSGVLILAESHLAVHTWPERGFAAVDLFTCGARPHSARLADHLKSVLAAQRVECRLVERGAAVTTTP